MTDEDADGNDGDELDAETEAVRLESVERYLAHLRDTTPYYDWLRPRIRTVERGLVRVEMANEDRVSPPPVGPTDGINGGVTLTLVDAVGMAAVIAEALEPLSLATTQVNLTFHDGVDDDYVIEGSVVDFGETLATTEIRVYPAAEADAAEPTLIATGQTSARLFG